MLRRTLLTHTALRGSLARALDRLAPAAIPTRWVQMRADQRLVVTSDAAGRLTGFRVE